MTLRLTLTPHPGRPGQFDAYLGDQLVVTSGQPLYDGARALLALGYSATELLTTIHRHQPHDSFRPSFLGVLATGAVSPPSDVAATEVI